MFSAGRILRQNRRLSSLPPGSNLPRSGSAAGSRPRRKEKRKFRCYLPFMWSALAMTGVGLVVIVGGTGMCIAGWYLGHFGDADDEFAATPPDGAGRNVSRADDARAPEVVGEKPEIEDETPEVDRRVPKVVAEKPEIDDETPAVDIQAPEVVGKQPKIDDEAPEVDKRVSEVVGETAEMVSETQEVDREAPKMGAEEPQVVEDKPEVDSEKPESDADAPEMVRMEKTDGKTPKMNGEKQKAIVEVHNEAPEVVGMAVEVPPARGLAYAGPIVMSFGCFAVVFACVVVCETRDRVLETMEDRVRRGLPARPPGGIRADFYALVVEVRKRRVERHRHRRKLLQSDDDDLQPDLEQERSRVRHRRDDPDPDFDLAKCHDRDLEPERFRVHHREEPDPDFDLDRSHDRDLEPERPRIDHDATSPLEPTPSSADFRSPSTVNDFVLDAFDEPATERQLPSLRVEQIPPPCQPPARRYSNPVFSEEHLCSGSGVARETASPGSRQAARQAGQNLSPFWQLTGTIQLPSSASCSSFDNDMFCAPPEPGCTIVRTSERRQGNMAASQLPFPLLAHAQTLPYVCLERWSPMHESFGLDRSSAESFSLPTYLVHTASVHAIADRSPDPETAAPFDLRFGADVTSAGDVRDASGRRRNSGISSPPEVESLLRERI